MMLSMADILLGAFRVSGIEITLKAVKLLEIYAAELVKWNRKINLTTVTDSREIAVKNFVESLYASTFLISGCRLLDAGSGAGLPGIPLAIAREDITVTSVDAISKKIHFQRYISRTLGLKNFISLHSRIESLGEDSHKRFDAVISRAVTDIQTFTRLARPYVKDGGQIIIMKGPGLRGEIDSSGWKLSEDGFHIETDRLFTLPYGYGERRIIAAKRLAGA